MAPPRRTRFDTTRWSLIVAARDGSSEAQRALGALCDAYWYPLYAYVRRQGYDADDAQDLTQSFFVAMLERRDLHQVQPERGRFRSYLLAAIQHFLSNDRVRRRALKRGGGHAVLSIDLAIAEGRYARDVVDRDSPERMFDRRWATTVLEHALQRVRQQCYEAGKGEEFEILKPCLMGEAAAGGYDELAVALQSTAGAVRVAVHRLRRLFRQRLRDEIADTVLTTDEVDAEIRYLVQILRADGPALEPPETPDLRRERL